MGKISCLKQGMEINDFFPKPFFESDSGVGALDRLNFAQSTVTR